MSQLLLANTAPPSFQHAGAGFPSAFRPVMDGARIQLEGKLEQVEASVVVLKHVSEALGSEEIGPRELATIAPQLETFESLLPQLRRHNDSDEVSGVLAQVRTTTERLVRNAGRLCRAVGLPAPRSVHEVQRVLAPHVPVRLNTRLIARPGELVMLTAMFVTSTLASVSAGMPPVLLLVWLAQFLFLAVRSVRVVVSASSLRLGRYEWRLRDLRNVHFEVPGWMQQRGQRVVVVVETALGRTTRVKVPNTGEGLIAAVRATGVPVTRSGLVVVVSEVRIALEGQLEQVEVSVERLKRVQDLIRSRRVGREDLVAVDHALRTIAATVPASRRFSTNAEVVAAFALAAEAMTALLSNSRRLCRLLDVPLPKSVHEVRPALEPHLPVHLSATLVGTPLENAGALLIPAMMGVAGVLAPASTPLMPFVLAAGLFLGLSIVHGKRVMVSATRLRLGRRWWSLSDVTRIVIEGGSMVVAKIETSDGSTCEELLPGAIDPLIQALRAGGVAVSVQKETP